MLDRCTFTSIIADGMEQLVTDSQEQSDALSGPSTKFAESH